MLESAQKFVPFLHTFLADDDSSVREHPKQKPIQFKHPVQTSNAHLCDLITLPEGEAAHFFHLFPVKPRAFIKQGSDAKTVLTHLNGDVGGDQEDHPAQNGQDDESSQEDKWHESRRCLGRGECQLVGLLNALDKRSC